MSDYGVTPEGFARPSLQEILTRKRDRLRDELGPVNTGPESVFGQMLSAAADREDRLWQAMEAVYLSQYPSSAGGRSLDGAVELTNISRLPATRSIVNVVAFGEDGTTLAEGTQVENTSGDVLSFVEAVTIQASEAIRARIEVTDAQEVTYTITLDGTDYDYTATSGDTAETIAAALADALPGDVDAEADGAAVEWVAGDRETARNLSVSGPLSIVQVGSAGTVRAADSGPVTVLASTVSEVGTPVAGWDGVINYFDGDEGRFRESDSELRLRRRQSLAVAGSGTVEAIRARILQEVEDVTAVTVIENASPDIDGEGRPPHSFEAVVAGGLDQPIGDKIWEVKPAGIEAHGDVSVTVEDSQGVQQSVSFSRPIDVYIWANITITTNGVGLFPSNGGDQVASNFVEQGEGLDVGDNVIFQAFFAAIYEVPGIASATIELATSELPESQPDPGEFATENISIGGTEIALFLADRVNVEVDP